MPIEEVVQVSPAVALERVRRENAIVVDVRELEEFDAEHIAGAVSVPLNGMSADQLPPPGTPLIFYCGAGKRSCAAVSQATSLGATNVTVLEGGIANWKRTGLPTAQTLSPG